MPNVDGGTMSINPRGQLLERARQAYLDGTEAPGDVTVRPRILESWRRSTLHGLDPHRARPVPLDKIENDTQLVRALRPLIGRRESVLTEMSCGITATDSQGCVLERWVERAQFARRLDARGVVPGSSLAESDIGTSSTGIALETGESTMVFGAEHFADGAIQMSTAGAPVRHPVSRQIIGSINLTCGVDDSTPLMLQWIREIAARAEEAILQSVSGRERALLRTYLRGSRDTRHPVLCMNDSTIIGNASAVRLMSDMDQSSLLETALKVVQTDGEVRTELVTTLDGDSVHVVATPIRDGDGPLGAELRLRRSTRNGVSRTLASALSPDAATVLPGLAGRSVAWTRFCGQLAERNVLEPLLLVGEAGTGKTSVLSALVAGSRILDVQQVLGSGRGWIEELNDALSDPAPLVLDGLHVLEDSLRQLTFRVVADLPTDAPRVFAAMTSSPADELNSGVESSSERWPGAVIMVPPLRDRLGDIPILLQAITAARTASAVTPHWSPEAVHTLTRVQFVANISSLGRVVSAVLRRPIGPHIRTTDLPPEVRSMATRRQLSGLDLLEAHAISTALADADGNKKLAADRLGIARSTLYRKVRALGLDLNGVTY
jgi:transcriptional regulator of acetoin/glycerol metabolism